MPDTNGKKTYTRLIFGAAVLVFAQYNLMAGLIEKTEWQWAIGFAAVGFGVAKFAEWVKK